MTDISIGYILSTNEKKTISFRFQGLLANIDPNRIDDTDIENLISDLNVFINTPLITQKDDFNAGLQALEEVKSLMAALKICLLEVRTSVQSIRTDVANLESQISSLFDRLADSLNVSNIFSQNIFKIV